MGPRCRWAVSHADAARLERRTRAQGRPPSRFYQDFDVTVGRGTGGGTFTRNQHELANGGVLVWQLSFDRVGSVWSEADVAAGEADIYLTRLDVTPMYTRLRADGRVSRTFAEFETGSAPVRGWRWF